MRIIPADTSPAERKRINALEAMSSASAASFYTCEAFGQFSPEHNQAMAAYEAFKDRYEAVCREMGVAAYATYSED